MGEPDSKTCPRCNVDKPRSLFGKHANRKDGMQVYCIACMADVRREKQYDKQRWIDRKEAESARSAAYRAENSTRLREQWRGKAERQRQDNPGQKRAWNIARKYSQTRATPTWADMNSINSIYHEAKQLEAVDGQKRHVDHVIPLKHHSVCGLHVHQNLQILTAVENMSKRNRFRTDWE